MGAGAILRLERYTTWCKVKFGRVHMVQFSVRKCTHGAISSSERKTHCNFKFEKVNMVQFWIRKGTYGVISSLERSKCRNHKLKNVQWCNFQYIHCNFQFGKVRHSAILIFKAFTCCTGCRSHPSTVQGTNPLQVVARKIMRTWINAISWAVKQE